jgi:HEPN domain-containing protein
LTGYAVESRYPGDYEPVDETEYIKSVEIAENVLKWVESKI